MTIEVRRGGERGRVIVSKRPEGLPEARGRGGGRLTVGPGLGTTFDGDSYSTPLVVTAIDDDGCVSWSTPGPAAALDRARREIDRRAPTTVRLREYPLLLEVLPAGSVSRLTCDLALAAGASGVPLIVSMDANGRGRGAGSGLRRPR
ncbi:hypothetical protein ACFQPA_03560 [Halomarina halobia]|uniref:Uncharacterized protein n=1 Tax=Halomarina halobia TaxID=3033386 RepID=A0ABD6A4M2_9EURY|nr:hypothetical protein [Halomarina sp. PSR21]